MANIPDGTKFHGVASFVDTTNRGSVLANSMRDAYTIEELSQFVNNYIINNSVTKIRPYFLTATPGGNTDYDVEYNMVDIDWDGGSGIHVLNLPSAASHPYRVIRISNNATVGANDKIHVTALPTETIDGVAFYNIQKPFNGIAVWSDGTRWIVIQAKSE
jgi:hypothetical protein